MLSVIVLFVVCCVVVVLALQAPMVEKPRDVLQRDASVRVLQYHFVSISFRTTRGRHWLMRHSRARQLALSIVLALEREEDGFSRVYKSYLCRVLVGRVFRLMADRHSVVVSL